MSIALSMIGAEPPTIFGFLFPDCEERQCVLGRDPGTGR